MESQIEEKLDVKSRYVRHLIVNVLLLLAMFKYVNFIYLKKMYISLKGIKVYEIDYMSLIVIFFILAFQLVYFFAYLLERITLYDGEKRSIFWLLGKYVSVLLNIAYTYTFVYWVIYLSIPNSIESENVLGTAFFEQFFNFFYFSIGNFLGMEGQIVPTGILFKMTHIIQSITVFLIIVFVLSNFNDIKKSYSKIYNGKE